MWIKNIILENFSAIKVGMKTNRLEIDFSNRINRVCLLVAPNGYGKTSLLATLTPFASFGNLDNRDGYGIILPDKDGYKEITIIDNDNEYVIKHFYTKNKSSHSVKSYICKNNEELNVNGNVTSFKSIIEEEFDIDISYLKLIRLGNNVTNMLDLSATERKRFLSNLLSELDDYLKLFKKLSEDSKILKLQISHTVDKLKRTGIDNIDNAKDDLSFLDKEINSLSDKRNDYLLKKGYYDGKLNEIDIYETIKSNKELCKKIDKLSSIDNKDNLSIDDINNKLIELSKDRESLIIKKSVYNTSINNLLSSLDNDLKEKELVLREIDKINNDESNKALVDSYNIIKERIDKLDNSFNDYNPSYTKEELNTLITNLLSIDNILNNIYELGKEPIKKVIKLLRNKEDVDHYINTGILDCTKSSDDSLIEKLIRDASNIELSCEYKICGMYKVWLEIMNIRNDNKRNNHKDRSLEFYKFMEVSYTNIKKIFNILGDNKTIIEKLPDIRKNDFLLDRVYDNIYNRKSIINIYDYNYLLSEITEYELYITDKEKLVDLSNRINSINENSSLKYLKNKSKSLSKKIDNTKDDISKYRVNIESIDKSITELDKLLSKYNDYKDYKTNLDSYINESNRLSSLIESYNNIKDEYDALLLDINNIESLLNKKSKERESLFISIKEFKSLNKDLNRYTKLYDENSYIKKSMSAKDGIPLEVINIYMGNIKNTINELLSVVYDNSIYIKDFAINSDEFRIPYIKDNYTIDDISKASQGETSFLSIALSFAMIYQSISKYNILLLDEMDSNLDKNYREKFLDILEILMDMINCEQIFLISHNNLFNMYPVDVLSLDGNIDESYGRANYILPIIE